MSRLKTLLRGIMASRDDKGDELHRSDMYFLFDGTAHHNIAKMHGLFTNSLGEAIEKSTKLLYVSIDEDSLHARKTRLKTGVSFEQMEYVSLVTREEFGAQIPIVKRHFFKGTNSGNKIGDVELAPLDKAWHLTISQKLALYSEYRVEVGGKTKGAGENELQKGKRKAAVEKEPAFWHARPEKLYRELIHSYQLKAVIDLSPGDGCLARVCTSLRIPYAGFTLSDVHTDLLKNYMMQELLTGATKDTIGCA